MFDCAQAFYVGFSVGNALVKPWIEKLDAVLFAQFSKTRDDCFVQIVGVFEHIEQKISGCFFLFFALNFVVARQKIFRYPKIWAAFWHDGHDDYVAQQHDFAHNRKKARRSINHDGVKVFVKGFYWGDDGFRFGHLHDIDERDFFVFLANGKPFCGGGGFVGVNDAHFMPLTGEGNG